MPVILLIAPGYPPGHSVSYERLTKFEKYLPEFGYKTCVLTVESHGRLSSDKAKCVYRAFEPGQLYRPFAQLLFNRAQHLASEHSIEQRGNQRRGVFEGTVLNGMRNGILDWLLIPDPLITWLPAAVLLGLKVIRTERVDIILSSSGPETGHLVAVCLAAITNKPWVADFRDGWLFESLKPILRRDNIRRSLEERLERLVVSQANAVTSVTQPISDYFRTTYPAFYAKFHTIPNGYDPDDWEGISPFRRDTNKFRIVHTGSFSLSSTTRDPRPSLEALKALEMDVREKIEVLLVGDLAEQEKEYIATLGLGDTVRAIGRVSKQESLAYQLSADLLLLLVGKDKSVATTKLYEYLYAGRPILAVSAVDTAAADIITQSQSGYVVNPTDSQAIACCLTQLFHRWQKQELVCQTINIEHYHRRYITQQLAGILDKIIINHQSSIVNDKT